MVSNLVSGLQGSFGHWTKQSVQENLMLYGYILKGKISVQTKAVFLLFSIFIDKHDGLAGEIPSLNK